MRYKYQPYTKAELETLSRKILDGIPNTNAKVAWLHYLMGLKEGLPSGAFIKVIRTLADDVEKRNAD